MQPFDSPEEAAFRAEARAWLETHAERFAEPQVAPSAIVAEWTPEEEERKLAAAQEWQQTKYKQGWAGIDWPAEYEGRGGTAVDQLIFSQEEARFDVPHDALVVGLGWCGPAIMAHGSDEQKQRFLPPLLRGEEIWCQLFSEPAAGSDLAGLATKAERDGDEWVLSGQKVWTTFAHRSDWGLCIARHDPELPKHRGLTAFVVDMRAPGVECRGLRQMTDSSNFNEVFLDGVRVPDRDRIGEVGDGWRVAITTFMHERMSGSFRSGGALEALKRLIADLGVADDPWVRDRFTALYARAKALQYTALRLLTAVSQDRLPGPEGSIMKLAGALLITDLYEFAVELLGPHGTLEGRDAPWAGQWHAAFLGTPGLRIGGGTDQIQRNIIGERVLGLPGDLRVDKQVPFSDVPQSA
ncbi:MAG: acyl-CoA dehydrogenase family protein [Acidimicrobiia bacterium]